MPFPLVHTHPGLIVRRCPVGKYQNADHQGEEGDDGSHWLVAAVTAESSAVIYCAPGLFLVVDQMHDDADHECKQDGACCAGKTDLGTQYFGGHHDGHDIDCGA